MHVDLQRVVESEKIRIRLPIHFKGESISPGVKTQGGVVSHMRADVEVSCLPADLPEFLELDLSGMSLNDTKFLADIPLPPGSPFRSSRSATPRWCRSTRRAPRSRSRWPPKPLSPYRPRAQCRRRLRRWAPREPHRLWAPPRRQPAGAGDAKKGEDKKEAAPGKKEAASAKKEGGKK